MLEEVGNIVISPQKISNLVQQEVAQQIEPITRAFSRQLEDSARDICKDIEKLGAPKISKGRAWLNDWNGLGIGIGLLLTLVGANSAIYREFDKRFSVFEERTTNNSKNTDEHLARIEKRLDSLEERLSSLELRVYSAGPVTAASAAGVMAAINNHIANRVKLPLDQVVDLGRRYTAASESTPGAWDAALALISYKSLLNTAPNLTTTNQQAPVGGGILYVMEVPQGKARPMLAFGPIVPLDQAAIFRQIGTSQVPPASVGNSFVKITGGALVVDSLELRAVVFENVEIHYDGGPIRMSNVYFLNCRFVLKNAPNSQRFATAALTPGSSTTFTAG